MTHLANKYIYNQHSKCIGFYSYKMNTLCMCLSLWQNLSQINSFQFYIELNGSVGKITDTYVVFVSFQNTQTGYKQHPINFNNHLCHCGHNRQQGTFILSVRSCSIHSSGIHIFKTSWSGKQTLSHLINNTKNYFYMSQQYPLADLEKPVSFTTIIL